MALYTNNTLYVLVVDDGHFRYAAVSDYGVPKSELGLIRIINEINYSRQLKEDYNIKLTLKGLGYKLVTIDKTQNHPLTRIFQ